MKNYIKPKGYHPGKIPYINAHIQLLDWKKAVVIGWEHADNWLEVKELLVIDYDPEALAPLREQLNVIPVLKDALQSTAINIIKLFNPDVVFFNLHGKKEKDIVSSLLELNVDLLVIATNRDKKFYVENGFHLENVHLKGSGALYVATLIRKENV